MFRSLFQKSTSLTKFYNIQRCCSITPAFQPSRVPETRRDYGIKTQKMIKIPHRQFSKSIDSDSVASNSLNLAGFESVCSETLETLCEYFEEIVEIEPKLTNPDIIFSVSFSRFLVIPADFKDLSRTVC
jgi:hypothetical protein